MLKSLSIRDFIIVESLELEFDEGLTVFTGETGAGKSILIDALSLALGGRGEASVVRAGASRAEVSALFEAPNHEAFNLYLEEMGLSLEEGQCVLRRLIDQQGKSRAFFNGVPVTLMQLKEVSQYLINIHGQHAHQTLQQNATQRQLLDRFIGHEALLGVVAQSYRDWQTKLQAWRQWQERSVTLASEEESLRFDIKELEGHVLEPSDWQEFNEQHRRLTYAQQVLDLNQTVLEVLADEDNNALDGLNKAQSLLAQMPYEDSQLKPAIDLLQSATIQLDEALTTLRHFVHSIEVDERELSSLDEKMSRMLQLSRRYRVPPEALWQELANRRQRLIELEKLSDGEALEREERQAWGIYEQVAKQLTQSRSQGAESLSHMVSESLQDLALGEGRFEIRLTPLAQPSLTGMDQVSFLVATHAKQMAQEIAKVASGGELSRISLAIQAALSVSSDIPSLIFDEVDTGIGGGVAEIVGRLLKQLGVTHQVLCVTHLPQVACCADHHFRVLKERVAEDICSRVEVLTPEDRITEIARMLGGIEITSTTLDHAQEMLLLARQ